MYRGPRDFSYASLFTHLNAPVLVPLVFAVSDVKALLAIKSLVTNDVPALSSAIPSPQSAPKELIPTKHVLANIKLLARQRWFLIALRISRTSN